jgi:hypothetical protein
MSNSYDIFVLNVDWLTDLSKIAKARHKDVIVTITYSLVRLWQQGRGRPRLHDFFFNNK